MQLLLLCYIGVSVCFLFSCVSYDMANAAFILMLLLCVSCSHPGVRKVAPAAVLQGLFDIGQCSFHSYATFVCFLFSR